MNAIRVCFQQNCKSTFRGADNKTQIADNKSQTRIEDAFRGLFVLFACRLFLVFGLSLFVEFLSECELKSQFKTDKQQNSTQPQIVRWLSYEETKLARRFFDDWFANLFCFCDSLFSKQQKPIQLQMQPRIKKRHTKFSLILCRNRITNASQKQTNYAKFASRAN